MSSFQRGFTLIEALTALAIAAVALVVLMGRLGSSADIQRTLNLHEMALDAAYNKLAEDLVTNASADDRSGTIESGELKFEWRSWSEKTQVDGFIRRNVGITIGNEPEVSLFVYQNR